jgi:ABC-type transport system involved in multi-copper enzyme maturation permease subunit
LRIIWACAKKDFYTSLTERIFLVTLIVVPLQYLFLFIIFVLPADHAPTAVVMQDQGPYAAQMYRAMEDANSFSLFQTSEADAARQFRAGKIVAVVTIPPDFDTKVSHRQSVIIPVQINNLNTDFTEDIRRAVPLSIVKFYAQAFPKLVTVVPHERDWYAHDTGYIQYIGVSIFVLALSLAGAIQSGTSWAREWELGTMNELLLSPASRWSLIFGKMAGAFVLAFVSAGVTLASLVLLLRITPMHIGEMLWYAFLTLIIFCALGTLIGTLVRQRRLITTIVLGSSLFVFFISGPLGPPSFSTPTINFLSHLFPLAYAIAGEQHAFHGFDTNTLGSGNMLALVGFAAMFLTLALATLLLKGRNVIAKAPR